MLETLRNPPEPQPTCRRAGPCCTRCATSGQNPTVVRRTQALSPISRATRAASADEPGPGQGTRGSSPMAGCPGSGSKHHGDGFRFTPGPHCRNGKLRLPGIGTMSARGEARTPGKSSAAISCQRRMDGFCPLSLSANPGCCSLEAGLDWRLETFATLAHAPDDSAALHKGGRGAPSASIGVSSLPPPSLPDLGNLGEGPPGAPAKSVTRRVGCALSRQLDATPGRAAAMLSDVIRVPVLR
jgi:hypothetical protein